MKFSFKNIKDVKNVKKVYMQVVLFAMIIHITYIAIYAYLSVPFLMMYNIGSVIFYIAMMFCVNKEMYRLGVTAVHAEVSLFVAVGVFNGAAGTGMGMYLLAMASMVYFCPYKHKSIPYLFSIGEMLLYAVLRYCSDTYMHPYTIQGIESTILHIYNAFGSFLAILLAAFFSDASAAVTKKKLTDANRELRNIANYDYLTGLQSRRLFMSKIEKRKRRNENGEVTICIGDIDDFKKINDTYGHNCGDYVLQRIAELMRQSVDLKNVDICRWGGEEFLFLFHEDTFSDARECIEKLREKIACHEFIHENKTISVTMTFGMVTRGGGEFDFDMLDKADEMLYDGKHRGKNVVISEAAA